MSFDLLEESKRLIGIRSDPVGGTRVIAEYLAPFCQKLGLNITFQSSTNGSAAREVNLIAHTLPPGSRDLCPGGLLLVTHLDTVPAGNRFLWSETGGDPFQAVVQGDRLYGLGSADTKLDFLCKVSAIDNIVRAYRDTPLHEIVKVPLTLVGTFGEERALAGARLLQESGIVHPKWVLVGEPSELTPVLAHKGILYLKAVWEGKGGEGEKVVRKMAFTGQAAHGSTPHLGENAVLKSWYWLFEEWKQQPMLQLREINGGTVHNIVPESCEIAVFEGSIPCPRIFFLKKFSEVLKAAESYLSTQENGDFDPPQTTVNVGVIRGDLNRIEIEFDFRLIPETDGNMLFDLFRSLSREAPGGRVEVIRSNPPLNTDRRSEIAGRVEQALQEVGLPVRFGVKSGNTEAAIFQAMGAEVIVIGPGKSLGNIHRPNEYNEMPQLQKAVEFYEAFLKGFC